MNVLRVAGKTITELVRTPLMAWSFELVATVVGTAVAVLTAIVGYRKQTGAKRERISTARAELMKVLEKRLVLADLLPTANELDELVDAKASVSRVARTYMPPPREMYRLIRLRIWENDYLADDKRSKLLSLVDEQIQQMESSNDIEPRATGAQETQSTWASLASVWLIASFLGLLASAAIMAVLVGPSRIDSSASTQLSAGLVVSTFGLVSIVLLRLRDQAKSEGKVEAELSELTIEARVKRELKKAGMEFSIANTPKEGFDFRVDAPVNAVLEVKNWGRRFIPGSLVQRVIERAEVARNQAGAERAIIVTALPLILSASVRALIEESGISVVSVDELSGLLKSLKAAAGNA